MIFSHAYLFMPGEARLVYNVAGGQSERAFPADVSQAVAAEWDAETLTLELTLEGGLSESIAITEADIEAAKETEAL